MGDLVFRGEMSRRRLLTDAALLALPALGPSHFVFDAGHLAHRVRNDTRRRGALQVTVTARRVRRMKIALVARRLLLVELRSSERGHGVQYFHSSLWVTRWLVHGSVTIVRTSQFHIGAASGLTKSCDAHGEPRTQIAQWDPHNKRGSTLGTRRLGDGAGRREARQPRAKPPRHPTERRRPCTVALSNRRKETGRELTLRIATWSAKAPSVLSTCRRAQRPDLVSLGVGSTRLQRHGIAQTEQVGEVPSRTVWHVALCAR